MPKSSKNATVIRTFAQGIAIYGKIDSHERKENYYPN